MNCPKCMRLLEKSGNDFVCNHCNLMIGTPPVSPVVDKTIEPQGSIGDIETKELETESVEIIEKDLEVCEEE